MDLVVLVSFHPVVGASLIIQMSLPYFVLKGDVNLPTSQPTNVRIQTERIAAAAYVCYTGFPRCNTPPTSCFPYVTSSHSLAAGRGVFPGVGTGFMHSCEFRNFLVHLCGMYVATQHVSASS